MAVFLQAWSEAKKHGRVQCFFSRLRHHRDYGDPCPVRQVKHVTGGTSREVGQSVSLLWFAYADRITGDTSGEMVQGLGLLWFANSDPSTTLSS